METKIETEIDSSACGNSSRWFAQFLPEAEDKKTVAKASQLAVLPLLW